MSLATRPARPILIDLEIDAVDPLSIFLSEEDLARRRVAATPKPVRGARLEASPPSHAGQLDALAGELLHEYDGIGGTVRHARASAQSENHVERRTEMLAGLRQLSAHTEERIAAINALRWSIEAQLAKPAASIDGAGIAPWIEDARRREVEFELELTRVEEETHSLLTAIMSRLARLTEERCGLAALSERLGELA